MAAALPLLYILVAARAAEAIVGPATPIVEMTGHRILPLVNSLVGVASWAALSLWLVPLYGAPGMAIAVGVATVAIAYMATLELQLTERLSPFDRKLFLGLGSGAGRGRADGAGGLVYARPGPLRLGHLLVGATSWCAVRLGLVRGDREALGALARTLRLVAARPEALKAPHCASREEAPYCQAACP